MKNNEDNIRRGAGQAFIYADLYASAMCNLHADLYIQWYCCTHPFRSRVCAILRRQCLTERVGCSAHKCKSVQ